eukprot:9086008-Alexandrium_andersonii.AAC.1
MVKAGAGSGEGPIGFGGELLELRQGTPVLNRLGVGDHGSRGPAFLAGPRKGGNPLGLALLALGFRWAD